MSYFDILQSVTQAPCSMETSAGRVVFRFDKAGKWLLRGTDVRKSTRTDADWESDFATLTLEVKAK